MQRIFVTGDTHFGHIKLIEYGRPPDFEAQILKGYQDIPHDALLIHLGDICIGKDAKQHEMLNESLFTIEHKILVRGNHDKKSMQWYMQYDWDLVVNNVELEIFKKKVLFSHVPVNPLIHPDVDFNVHGHTHGNSHRDHEVQSFYNAKYHKEYAPDTNNYLPQEITKKYLGLV